MRRWLGFCLAVSLLGAAQPAFAESGALAPAGAAGVEAAQSGNRVDKAAALGMIGLVVVGAYLAVGTHYNDYPNARKSHSSHATSGTH